MKNLVCKKCWIKYLHRLIYNLYILYIEIKTFEFIIYATLNYNLNYLLTLFKFETLLECNVQRLLKALRSRSFRSENILGVLRVSGYEYSRNLGSLI